jgi:hypothetical protein
MLSSMQAFKPIECNHFMIVTPVLE